MIMSSTSTFALCKVNFSVTSRSHLLKYRIARNLVTFKFDGLVSNWVYLILAKFTFDSVAAQNLRCLESTMALRCHSVWFIIVGSRNFDLCQCVHVLGVADLTLHTVVRYVSYA